MTERRIAERSGTRITTKLEKVETGEAMTSTSWSRWSPEQHMDEAQRLARYKDPTLNPIAQIHADLAIAKMINRLDSSVDLVGTLIGDLTKAVRDGAISR